MRVINDHAERTGKKVMFAFNLTGDLDEMRRRHDLVAALGGTCVMASLNSVGLVGMIELARVTPIADPRPSQRLGLSVASPAARLVLRRLAEDLAARRRRPHACQRPRQQIQRNRRERHRLGAGLPDADVCREALHSSCRYSPRGRRRGRRPRPIVALGSADLIYAAGGGIMAHPLGPAAGVAAMQEAWEAALAGVPLAEFARDRPNLQRALEMAI